VGDWRSQPGDPQKNYIAKFLMVPVFADQGAGSDALNVQWSFIHGNLIIW
jgi:hypothetical protein